MAEKVKGTPGYNPVEHPKNATDKAFRIALYLKALDGLLEILGGVFLLLINPVQINRWAARLTQGELSEDPHDFIANHILKSAHNLTGASLTFGAAYLLIQGSVKLIIVFEVMRGHLWAYLLLIGVISLFVVYQLYRLVDKFSIALALLTAFDLLIIYLAQNEYRRQLRLHDGKLVDET
jgi:uncharacterized membrane protein